MAARCIFFSSQAGDWLGGDDRSEREREEPVEASSASVRGTGQRPIQHRTDPDCFAIWITVVGHSTRVKTRSERGFQAHVMLNP